VPPGSSSADLQVGTLQKVVPPGSSSADLQVGTSEGRAAGQQ